FQQRTKIILEEKRTVQLSISRGGQLTKYSMLLQNEISLRIRTVNLCQIHLKLLILLSSVGRDTINTYLNEIALLFLPKNKVFWNLLFTRYRNTEITKD